MTRSPALLWEAVTRKAGGKRPGGWLPKSTVSLQRCPYIALILFLLPQSLKFCISSSLRDTAQVGRMFFELFLWLFTIGFCSAQTACNGNAALCDRLYSNISLIGTHDSAFVGDLPTENQDLSVTDQLNAGIRFLQAQTVSHRFARA